LEKEHPDWLRALTPRHINAPAEYWPQKVLAISSANAAMQNYVSVYEHQTKPNPALAAVHGQAAQLLRYEVPTYYVSRELPVRATFSNQARQPTHHPYMTMPLRWVATGST